MDKPLAPRTSGSRPSSITKQLCCRFTRHEITELMKLRGALPPEAAGATGKELYDFTEALSDDEVDRILGIASNYVRLGEHTRSNHCTVEPRSDLRSRLPSAVLTLVTLVLLDSATARASQTHECDGFPDINSEFNEQS